MNKKHKCAARILAVLTIACMIFTVVPAQNVSAASMTDKSYVDSMTVGNTAGDSVTITKIAPDVLHVQCTHSLEYTRMDVRLFQYGTNTKVTGTRYISYGMEAGGSWEEYLYCEGIPDGKYKLTVYKQDDNDPAMQYRPYVDRITVEAKNGEVNLVDYVAIRSQNSSIRAKGSASSYKDKAMTDFKYMLFNEAGKTSKRTISSSTESAYYKKIADQIVNVEDNDYTKLWKIYTYVAENLYYDNYKTSKPYDDPYYNLKHINSTSGSGYNWSNGKVAAQCDGYAGLFIALARSQGIPARMVGGNLLSSTKETWESEASGKGVKRNTHCWAQAYADGRWIEIDPCRATLSTRNSDGSWTKARQLNYMFFDMNDVQMAHTHCSVEFMGTASSSSSSTKKNQTITVGSTKYTKTIGNKAFSLGAKSKTSKTYKSSNTKVVTVSSAGKVTIKGTGKATITVTAKSSSTYNSATKKVTISVKPKQVTGLKLTKAKKSFTAKWSKATGASGYQVAYTTDKNFKKNIKTTTTTSLKKTVSKLTAKKTYYVKVRAYKKATDGTKIYGSYSSKKSIKTK